MVEKFKKYVEEGSFEEDLEKQCDLLDWFCWIVIIMASVYFAPAFFQILAREVF